MFRCLLGFSNFRPGPRPSHKAYIGVSSNVPLKLPDAIMSVQSSGVREERDLHARLLPLYTGLECGAAQRIIGYGWKVFNCICLQQANRKSSRN